MTKPLAGGPEHCGSANDHPGEPQDPPTPTRTAPAVRSRLSSWTWRSNYVALVEVDSVPPRRSSPVLRNNDESLASNGGKLGITLTVLPLADPLVGDRIVHWCQELHHRQRATTVEGDGESETGQLRVGGAAPAQIQKGRVGGVEQA